MGRLTHRTRPGFTYFVTTKCWENRAIFQVHENANMLVECMLRYRDHGSFLLHEFVVMPNHLDLLLTPAGSTSVERAIQLIKGGSSHEIHHRRDLRLQIWQPGFHEESIRERHDYQHKTEYIRMNPVRARLVERSEDWPSGSACGSFRTDPIPERLNMLASAAKAVSRSTGGMSELKLRPPKNQKTPGLKSPSPESPSQHTEKPPSPSRPPEERTA